MEIKFRVSRLSYMRHLYKDSEDSTLGCQWKIIANIFFSDIDNTSFIFIYTTNRYYFTLVVWNLPKICLNHVSAGIYDVKKVFLT